MLRKKGNPLKIHSKVHFFKMDYSIGFYTGGGNIEDWHKLSKDDQKAKLQKNWYVWWSFRNPETQQLERQNNIKLGINIHKTKASRLMVMQDIKLELLDLLKTGYSPYELPSVEPEYIDIDYAFREALKVKKKEIKERTYEDYHTRLKTFNEYLKKNGYVKIREIDKNIVSNFLNRFSAKNSNNFRAAISSVFSVLSDLSYIDYNFIKELRAKKTESKKAYIPSKKEIERTIKLLKQQDFILLMYIDFVSYMFWRPVEVVRIKIENINFDKRSITVDTKSKKNKVKLIPSIILENIKEFVNGKNGFLFELNAKKDKDKRSYLTDRFKKFILLNELDSRMTPYSFRHYNITLLYIELRKKLSKEDTIKELSLITGHTSKAILNYIHANDLELPKDYSNLFKQIK